MTTAGFIRVSKQEQALGHSPDTQRRVIRDYCRAMDWGEPEWFEDLGVSAWTDEVEDRPAFARMLAACHAGAHERVVVYKLDRWARDLVVSVRELRALEEIGVGFISVSERFDFSTPFGRVMLAILSAFAQHQSDLISERTRLGLATKALKGQPNGPAPYGATRGEDQLFRPDPARVDSLRRILELAPVMSWEGLARALNAEGVPAYRGGRWSEGSVRRLVLRSSDWLEGQPEPWPSLLAAAKERPDRPPVPGRLEIHMLTGLARCACGGRLYYASTRGRRRLACRNRAGRGTLGGYGCDRGPFGWADDYHAQVTAQLLALPAPEDWHEGPSPDAATATARAELAEDRRRLAATYRARLIDDAEFEAERRALDARAAALPRAAPQLASIRHQFGALRLGWSGMTGAEQNAVLRLLCRDVLIEGKRATVRWRDELLALLPD